MIVDYCVRLSKKCDIDFYSGCERTTFKNIKYISPIIIGNFVKIFKIKYKVLNMRLENSNHLTLWLEKIDKLEIPVIFKQFKKEQKNVRKIRNKKTFFQRIS